VEDSIFAEFQYFIKRINNARAGIKLTNGETLEDLEQRFRIQVENGLVIHDPDGQELAMDILLSNISEAEKRKHLTKLRTTGSCDFRASTSQAKMLSSTGSKEGDMERAVDLMIKALKKAGVKAQKQKLGIKMFHAAHEMNNVDFCDPDDLKLLFVRTINISGHVKKGNPIELAESFNSILKSNY